MTAMNVNTNTYALAGSASSSAITFIEQDAQSTSIIVYNSDATYPAFVVTGASSPTAAVPASATVPVAGKMIAPGSTQTFTKGAGAKYLAAIWTGAATGSLYVSVGAGE